MKTVLQTIPTPKPDVASILVPTIKIIDCGKLSDIVWPGSVSAARLIQEKKTTQYLLEEAVRRIGEFYIDVNLKAKTRCIDGRHDPKLIESELGPQVPGGAPGAALAYRLGVDEDDLTRGTFLSDAEMMISSFLRLGFSPGGHRDEYSDSDHVGCGAIDGMDKVLATMTRLDMVEDHKRVVRLLLGSDFDRNIYLRIMGAAVLVNSRSDEYFYGRGRVIDVLEERALNSIAILRGQHQECVVAINLVPYTTLSSNQFAKEFGGIQAFGYDLWRSKEMAQKILPLPSQAQACRHFIMARVMSTVATLMALTDGSQRLVMRIPGEETSIEQ